MTNEQLRRRLLGLKGSVDRRKVDGNGMVDRHGVSKPLPKSAQSRAWKEGDEEQEEEESRAALKRRRTEPDLKLRSATDLFGSLSTNPGSAHSRAGGTADEATGNTVRGSVDGQSTASSVRNQEAESKKKRPVNYLDEVLAEKEKKRNKNKKKKKQPEEVGKRKVSHL